jgi:transcriptional regulator with XRE-family HTH domain
MPEHDTPREAGFGTRMRHRRMERHLRQIDLAHLLEEPQSYISRWESGELQYMTLDRLRRLAWALQTTVDDLIGREDRPAPPPVR